MKDSVWNRDFTMVVIGQIISLFGNAILRFALPLYLLRETASPSLFGAVTACSFLPMVFFSLIGGVIADRVNKRNIMVILDFFTALVTGIFYLSVGRLPLVPLMTSFLMLLYGISGAYQPSVQASVPLLVASGALIKGNAVINMIGTLSNLLGPVLGGILFGYLGIAPILVIAALCFLISAVMELFIQIPYKGRDGRQGIFETIRSDIKDSFQFVKREKPILFSVVGVLAAFNLVLSAAMIVGIPIIVVQRLGMSDADLGIAQGALGVGGLVGGILMGGVTEKWKIRSSYLFLLICSAATLCMGIFILLPVPNTMTFWMITVMSAVAMCVATMFTISLFTVVQQQTPKYLLGKIMATIVAVAGCSQPAGQAIYGMLFETAPTLSPLIMICAAGTAFLISLYSKKLFIRLEQEKTYPQAEKSLRL